jgi:iron complex transport system substrate-binding protein
MDTIQAPSTSRRRRRWLPVLAVLAAFGLLAACGSDNDSSGGSSDTTAPSGADEVTIEHAFGSTEVPVRPERIVSLDNQWTDVLLAMGQVPVGHAEIEGFGNFPWDGDELDDSEKLTTDGTSIPIEKVAGLRPDLIVASWQITDQSIYDQLSKIAPTIALLTPGQAVDSWQDMTKAAGEFLDDTEGATDIIDGVDAQIAEMAEELPGLKGKTYVMANYVPGDQIYVVADPDDGAADLFYGLGLEISPTILDNGDPTTKRAQISMENISMLDGDLLFLLPNGADPATIPGYSTLPAVVAGASMLLDNSMAIGINTPTPLSVPWMLEQMEPTLKAAAAG